MLEREEASATQLHQTTGLMRRGAHGRTLSHGGGAHPSDIERAEGAGVGAK